MKHIRFFENNEDAFVNICAGDKFFLFNVFTTLKYNNIKYDLYHVKENGDIFVKNNRISKRKQRSYNT